VAPGVACATRFISTNFIFEFLIFFRGFLKSKTSKFWTDSDASPLPVGSIARLDIPNERLPGFTVLNGLRPRAGCTSKSSSCVRSLARRHQSHAFRHPAITELLEQGAPEQTVIAIAGWVGRRMVETYSHTRLEAKSDALNLLSGGSGGYSGPKRERKPAAAQDRASPLWRRVDLMNPTMQDLTRGHTAPPSLPAVSVDLMNPAIQV
jgi:hypothetical protein